ncbi:mechanosensitive ion channel family protein [Membranicola marinus]|uniref:Mechanosensitive ion channel family protein n=1 Tax=Membranihabitans marinus TaxID=1227546 RepID=A0A953L9W4_9BACT|nr:mechanosensitive ion channel domain-containing protein [Membranihabitans marinus]MBY5958063.1 mechanosensitive ion channel family protein [Membranihabitans marinus]
MSVLYNVIKVLLLLFLVNETFFLWSFLPESMTVQHGFRVISGLLVYLLVVDLCYRAVIWGYKGRKKMRSDHNDNVTLGLKNLYYILLAGGVFVMILALFGVDFRTFFTSISIVAAAIAIVTKDYIVDIISGIILSFSSYIKTDDYIKTGDLTGKVIDMTLSKILLLSDDDDIIAVPNNKAFSNEIVNYTRKASKKVTIDFEMQLISLNTIEDLEGSLVQILDEFKPYIEEDSYYLRIEKIHAESISLKFQYILKRMNRNIEKEIRKKTVRRVVNFVKSNAVNHARDLK